MMSQINNIKMMLTISMVIGVAFAAPSNNISEPSNGTAQSGSSIINNSMSAFIGRFNASAALLAANAGIASASGNGLAANGSAGIASASGNGLAANGSAGIASASGNGLAASSGCGNPDTGDSLKPEGSGEDGTEIGGNGLIERIFAIPIKILQSINTFLNKKKMYQAQSGAAPLATVCPDNGQESASVEGETKLTYDEIFNIPITALRFVQNLLSWLTR